MIDRLAWAPAAFIFLCAIGVIAATVIVEREAMAVRADIAAIRGTAR